MQDIPLEANVSICTLKLDLRSVGRGREVCNLKILQSCIRRMVPEHQLAVVVEEEGSRFAAKMSHVEEEWVRRRHQLSSEPLDKWPGSPETVATVLVTGTLQFMHFEV